MWVEMTAETLTIGALSKLTRLTPKALRYREGKAPLTPAGKETIDPCLYSYEHVARKLFLRRVGPDREIYLNDPASITVSEVLTEVQLPVGVNRLILSLRGYIGPRLFSRNANKASGWTRHSSEMLHIPELGPHVPPIQPSSPGKGETGRFGVQQTFPSRKGY